MQSGDEGMKNPKYFTNDRILSPILCLWVMIAGCLSKEPPVSREAPISGTTGAQ